jgi:hypothetical protein
MGITYDLKLGPSDPDMPEIWSYSRQDRSDKPSDLGTIYQILEWDPLILGPKETIHDLLRELAHAASCGCEGCSRRIEGTYAAWQSRRKENEDVI